MVEGYVLDSAGQKAVGATVTIDGPDWSRRIMTDDSGRYGFAGLCAGSATLQAFLATGQAGPVVTVTLSGNNSLRQDLHFATSSTAPTQATPASQATAQPTPTGTAEAGMPVTGYAGWLLAGGAALGALLLLSAGGRRALQAYERARSRQ
ncbi:MAG: carboxypeptidase regulatory-like domain-containing protein [Anaerolineaceae bacterium]|nr:carboxypeptidase regulatory-like domain-containing protein [Anaerolineaceae bacterium]